MFIKYGKTRYIAWIVYKAYTEFHPNQSLTNESA
jgi:hypothetical protein